MNENDSQILAGMLERDGYEPAPDKNHADIVIVNTCTVRESADRKAYGYLWELNKIKKNNPALKIVVAGCLAESEKETILKKLPFVDDVMGVLKYKECLPIKRSAGVSAFVTAMFGCNQFCSFCIVPFVRGREKSRPIDAIVDEVKNLDKSQIKEITLLGQKIDAYGKDIGASFDKLLYELNKIDGIERIRFFTSYPTDITDEIIDAVAELPHVCEYFHIPLQSGDDKILRDMNRGYNMRDYSEVVSKIREKIPDCAITSDLIVGFPGETEENFGNSINAVQNMDFDSVITAMYSSRDGTVAAKMEAQISDLIKKDRLNRLNKVVEEVALKKNQKLVGSVQEVLVESAPEPNRSGSGQCMGRTRTNKIVKFESEAKTGELVNVKIDRATAWTLYGK